MQLCAVAHLSQLQDLQDVFQIIAACSSDSKALRLEIVYFKMYEYVEHRQRGVKRGSVTAHLLGSRF